MPPSSASDGTANAQRQHQHSQCTADERSLRASAEGGILKLSFEYGEKGHRLLESGEKSDRNECLRLRVRVVPRINPRIDSCSGCTTLGPGLWAATTPYWPFGPGRLPGQGLGW